MRQIKFLAIALVLSLAGFVYAAGNAQESKRAGSTEKAGCCSVCCKAEDSCCKSHKMGNRQSAGAGASAQDKEMACKDCECCKDGKSCCAEGCKMSKTGKADGCCDKSKEGGCSSGGSACCSKDKAQTS